MDKDEKIGSLESKLSSLTEEMNNLKMVLSVSENTKQETVDELKQVHNQEIESLRCVLQDSMEEQRHELFHEFERERRRWEDEKNSFIKQIENHKKEKEVMNSSINKGDEEMDNQMKQAQFEAEKLRTVVLPLEEEILQLKKKLEEYTLKEESTSSDKRKQCDDHSDATETTVHQDSPMQNQETQSNSTSQSRASQCELSIPTTQHANDDLAPSHRVNSAPQLNLKTDQISSNQEPSNLQVDQTEVDLWKIKYEEEKKKVISYNDLKKKSDELLSGLNEKLDILERRFEDERNWRLKKETADNDEIGKLVKNRDHIKDAYISLKREHDSLRKLVEKHKMEVDYTMAVPPAATPEVYATLTRYKNALIASNTEKAQKEAKLLSKINFLEQTLRAEQVAKEQIENALSLELEETRVQLASFHSIQSQLDKETKERSDLETALEEEKLNVHAIRSKSRNIIKDIREKLIIEKELNKGLQKDLDDERNKNRSLQGSLETSEQVQRDFVQLSQSLQMQLEELRSRNESNSESSSQANNDANLTPAPS